MSKIVTLAKEQIENIIYTAAKKAIAEGVFPEAELGGFKIETPSNREHGDYAVNAAMVWSKAFRNAPRKIAEELTARAAEIRLLQQNPYHEDQLTFDEDAFMTTVSPDVVNPTGVQVLHNFAADVPGAIPEIYSPSMR